MKILKRVTAFFLMVVMVLAVSCTVFAKETEESPEKTAEISFPERPENEAADVVTKHTYVAYQIFSGDIEDGELLRINWGSGIEAEGFLNALKGNTEFVVDGKNLFEDVADMYDAENPKRSADAVAKIIASWESDDVKGASEFTAASNDKRARAFAKIAEDHLKEGITVVEGTPSDVETVTPGMIPKDGYYLVVDETQNFEGTVKNLSFLRLGGGEIFDPANKADVPELEKKVKEINDSEDIADAWKDAADYDIGDNVEFVLTGTLPADYDIYTTYKYVFHDTLSAGLALNEDSIKVYVNDAEVGRGEGWTFSKGNDNTFIVAFNDLKSSNPGVTAESLIRVAYSAELTSSAVIGGIGNKNTAYLEYSNDPDNAESTTKTPDDTVIAFTYKLIINKVKDSPDPQDPQKLERLEGAGFTLYKYNKKSTAEDKYEIVGTEITGVTTFEFNGIDAGRYKLVETTVPAGYNRADDLYFTVVADLDDTELKIRENGLRIDRVENAEGEEILNDVNGQNQKVFIFTPNLTDGSLTTDIVNQSGLLLPATGGIGTTIFYVVGGILVVGAGVLLIAKKRSDKTKSE